jgi:hypothetical protein
VVFFLPNSSSFLAFEMHQRKVARKFKFALGWFRERIECKTVAMELKF